MEKQSEHIPLTLTAAYEELQINDATISDKEVGVAYLRARRLPVEHPTEALQTIATARGSQWLHSIIVPILGSSTEETAATLQYEAQGIFGTTSDVMVQPSSDGFGPAPMALESSESYDKVDENANAKTKEGANEGANETIDTDEDDSSEPDYLSCFSSQSIYAPSSSEDSTLETDSDNESIYEAFFDWDAENGERGRWYCTCGEALIDGKCPYGHCGFCMSCGWNIVGDCLRCPETCQGCGEDKVDGVCAECDSEESKVEKDIITFDDVDGVWRCSECQWEIEADNETDGNCHCLDEGGSMRFVDLSQIPDYEPADDGASSTESSSDQEEDSDDEDAIDDGEDVMENERFGQHVDFDEAGATQDGESIDSTLTLNGHGLTSPTGTPLDGEYTPGLTSEGKRQAQVAGDKLRNRTNPIRHSRPSRGSVSEHGISKNRWSSYGPRVIRFDERRDPHAESSEKSLPIDSNLTLDGHGLTSPTGTPQVGESIDSNLTLNGHGLTSPTPSGPDNSIA